MVLNDEHGELLIGSNHRILLQNRLVSGKILLIGPKEQCQECIDILQRKKISKINEIENNDLEYNCNQVN